MLLAKSQRAAGLLSRLLKNNRIRKKYMAVVFGVPEKSVAELKHFLLEQEGNNTKFVIINQEVAKRLCWNMKF